MKARLALLAAAIILISGPVSAGDGEDDFTEQARQAAEKAGAAIRDAVKKIAESHNPPGRPVQEAEALPVALRDYVHSRYDETVLKVTQDLVSFQTVAEEGKSTKDLPAFISLRKYLEDLSRSLGMEYATYDGDQILEISVGSGPETLAFYAHADVMPVGDKPWDNGLDPWKGTIKNGRLYGRGALDDKGPMASILYGMKTMAEQNLIPAGKRIALVIPTQEEIGSWDGLEAFSKAKSYKWNLVADSLFPAEIAEKGIAAGSVTFPLDPAAPGALSRSYRVAALNAGSRVNQLAERAQAELEVRDAAAAAELRRRLSAQSGEYQLTLEEVQPGRVRIVANGKAAHGSTPQNGHNAVPDLIGFLSRLDLEPNSYSTFIRGVRAIFGTATDGSTVGLSVPEDTQYDPPGTTMVNCVLKEEAGMLEASFDVRFHHKFKADDVLTAITRKAKGVDRRFEVKKEFLLEPFYNDPKSPFVKLLVRIYAEESGETGAKPLSIGGATQTRVLSGQYRAAFGPLKDLSSIHGPNESIGLDELRKNTEIYLRAMAELLKGN